MPNIVKYNLSTSPNSIQSGNFNIAVNNTPTNISDFYTGICPIIGGYTIYINKASNGPSIYSPKNDSELIDITNKLGGNISTAADALVWLNSQSTMTVLNNNYPSIVTSGLAVNLDASFVSSYPKTGTTWKDLSGNGSNGALVNGPTFDSSNYGSIVFDGVNDVSTLPINTFTSGSPQNGTFILKLKTPPFNNTTQLIFFRDGGSTGNLIYFYRNAAWATDTYAWLIYSNAGANILYDTYLPNQWYETAFTFDSQGNVKTYIDGVLRDSEVWDAGSTSWNRSGSILPNLRCSSASGSGNIQRFMYYTRALSASEILQNYNAGLQRFIPTSGLTLSLDAQNTNLYAVSPTTGYDVSGNDNNVTLINGSGYGAYGDGSWSFDGIDDYLLLTNSITLSQTSNWTIQGWVASYQTNSTGAFLRIVGDQNSSNNYIFLERNNRLIGRNTSGGTFVFQASFTPALPLNSQFFLLTLVNDNGTLNLYSNTTQTTVNSAISGNVIFNTIMRERNSYSPGGFVSTFSHYNVALTLSEITTIYNATKSRYGL